MGWLVGWIGTEQGKLLHLISLFFSSFFSFFLWQGWLVGWIGAEQGRVTLGRWSSPDQPRAGILSQEQAAQIKRLVVHKKWEIPGSCLRYSLIRWPLKKLATQQKRHCCNLDMGTLRKLFLASKRVQSLGFIVHDRHWFASLAHISIWEKWQTPLKRRSRTTIDGN